MPDPEALVVRVVRMHREALQKMEATQMASMAGRWIEMERLLAGRFSALALEMDLMRANGEEPSLHKVLQLQRYKELRDQVREELRNYVGYAEGEIRAAQEQWGGLGIENAADAIRTVQAENAVLMSFNVLPAWAIETMVGLAGDGSPLRKLLEQSYGEAAGGLLKVLQEAMVLGWGAEKTAAAMANGFGVGLNRAFRIARTEQNRVYREASRMEYKASGLVDAYQRMAAKSSRTCMACLIADGRIYQVDETFEEHSRGTMHTGADPARIRAGELVERSGVVRKSAGGGATANDGRAAICAVEGWEIWIRGPGKQTYG